MGERLCLTNRSTYLLRSFLESVPRSSRAIGKVEQTIFEDSRIFVARTFDSDSKVTFRRTTKPLGGFLEDDRIGDQLGTSGFLPPARFH